jgi:hypothetical protein
MNKVEEKKVQQILQALQIQEAKLEELFGELKTRYDNLDETEEGNEEEINQSLEEIDLLRETLSVIFILISDLEVF